MRTLRAVLVAFILMACAVLAQKPASNRAAADPHAAPQAQPVDINSATEQQLRTVPGIGEAYAKKIVAGRPYRSKNELVQKKILPAGVYDRAKEHLIAKQK